MIEKDKLPGIDPSKLEEDIHPVQPEKKNVIWRERWDRIVRLGLGELSIRVGTAIASVGLVLLVVWIMGRFYLQGEISAASPVVNTESCYYGNCNCRPSTI